MKFFVLTHLGSGIEESSTSFLPASDAGSGDAPRCEKCGQYVGLRPIVAPLLVELEARGHEWADLVLGVADQVLISEKLKNLMMSVQLSGFSLVESVEVSTIRRRGPVEGPPPRYWLATVTRSNTRLDEIESGLERSDATVCAECGVGGVIKRLRRVVIQPGSWSGEDVFYARGLPGTILVSDRFRSLCEEGGVLNLPLVDAGLFGFDFYPEENVETSKLH